MCDDGHIVVAFFADMRVVVDFESPSYALRVGNILLIHKRSLDYRKNNDSYKTC
jgi:hypothetical protein